MSSFPKSKKSLFVIDLGVTLQSACGILCLRANLCSDTHNPAPNFRVIGEFSQMHLRGRNNRIYRVTLSTSPNTSDMMSHGQKTISVVQIFSLAFPENLSKSIVCNGSSLPLSQFLLFSEFPMMLPNILNHCMILQAVVGQVGNQRFQGYSYLLVYFAASWIRRRTFCNSMG